ncbi:Nsp1-like C-terminal region-domain-containing protein [Scleroderma citrinum]
MSTPQNNQGGISGTSLFGSTAGNTGTGTTSSASTPSIFGSIGSGSNVFGNAPLGGLFGKPATPTAGSPATTPSLFGGPASSTSAASTASIFGKPATPALATGAPSSSAPGTTPNLFGGAGVTATTNTPGSSFFATTPTSSSQTSFFSNINATPSATIPKSFVPLTSNTATGPAAGTTSSTASTAPGATKDTPTTTAPSTGGLFGLPVQKTDSTEKKDAPAAAPTFNLFGSKDTSGEKKDSPTTSIGLFGAKPAASTAGSPLVPKEGDKPKDATSASASVAVAPPSVLKGKTIEEIVNKWSSELENQIREFNKFAAEVAVWDRALMENGNNLAALYSHVVAVEKEQTEIDHTLDHIEQQQRDLSATLDAYERSAEEILGNQGGSLRALDTGPADTERDKNYVLATELHSHLDDLSTSLMQMIDSVNALSLAPATNVTAPFGGDDPMVQISQILNSHLESLQWIDSAVREVEGKVGEVEQRVRDAGLGNSLGNGTTKQRGFGLSR